MDKKPVAVPKTAMRNRQIKTILFLVLGATTSGMLACGGGAAESTSVPPDTSTNAKAPKKKKAPSAEKTKPNVKASEETEWLAVLLNGRKSGYVKSVRTIFSDRVETEVTTFMEMQRAGMTLPILTVSKMTETPDGKPLRIEKHTQGAGMDQLVKGTIAPNGELRLTDESAGQVSSRTIPWPKGALMNEGQRLETLRYGLKEGVTYTSKYFDPDLLEALDVKIRVGARQQTDLFGRSVTGTKVLLKTAFRGTTSEIEMYVDDEMNTLRTLTDQMGMRVEMIACTKEYAKSKNDPAEMIRAAFVASPEALSKSRRMHPLTYEIRLLGKGRGHLLISTFEQSVQTVGEGQIVTVQKKTPAQNAVLPYRGDNAEALEALTPNPWIQSDAEEIRSTVETAVGNETDTYKAARNIERFVADYIEQKDLSVGYASALETLRSRQGDCTEHALLFAALCRAAGIPAQVVFGLVYVEAFGNEKNVFGGHAWTRVFVNGSWVSLDAALRGFDTGHIALAVSNGDPADFFKLIDLIGNLEITAVKQQAPDR
jgi:transglutaminase-like putative cysteine protease